MHAWRAMLDGGACLDVGLMLGSWLMMVSWADSVLVAMESI
jgi:hypothetical protein